MLDYLDVVTGRDAANDDAQVNARAIESPLLLIRTELLLLLVLLLLLLLLLRLLPLGSRRLLQCGVFLLFS